MNQKVKGCLKSDQRRRKLTKKPFNSGTVKTGSKPFKKGKFYLIAEKEMLSHILDQATEMEKEYGLNNNLLKIGEAFREYWEILDNLSGKNRKNYVLSDLKHVKGRITKLYMEATPTKRQLEKYMGNMDEEQLYNFVTRHNLDIAEEMLEPETDEELEELRKVISKALNI